MKTKRQFKKRYNTKKYGKRGGGAFSWFFGGPQQVAPQQVNNSVIELPTMNNVNPVNSSSQPNVETDLKSLLTNIDDSKLCENYDNLLKINQSNDVYKTNLNEGIRLINNNPIMQPKIAKLNKCPSRQVNLDSSNKKRFWFFGGKKRRGTKRRRGTRRH